MARLGRVTTGGDVGHSLSLSLSLSLSHPITLLLLTLPSSIPLHPTSSSSSSSSSFSSSLAIYQLFHNITSSASLHPPPFLFSLFVIFSSLPFICLFPFLPLFLLLLLLLLLFFPRASYKPSAWGQVGQFPIGYKI